ncbi:peptide/nickel transport system permease protein [Arthrobacter sp. cf158]|uniref:ABC transporter permease n=1 Tax=Arthrobacter sp. cf158 TaxID=1761744 RepID=UPI000899FE36|nr:ABC transporter permease [Arthrobacter sp. cf158]SDW90129.1 peptide/nickel transport system permease protein [Arthrobacter sp. cf158]
MIAVLRILLGRVLQIVLVALFVTVGTGALVRLIPGDPARAILGSRASPEAVSALRGELGLDLPMIQQLGESVAKLFQGDLGTSFAVRGQDVLSLILPALAVTASLAAVALVFSIVSGVGVGLWLALVRRPEADLAGRLVMTVLLALPGFMAGLILLYVVSVQLKLAPAGGWAGSWPGNARYIWLPALALTIYLGSLIARAVRQAALDTIGEPFVQAARTRGVPRSRIVLRHILPNAILPVIPLVGLNAGFLVSGAVIVESVFALPGLGAKLLEAMGSRDLPVVQGIALITALSIVVFNLLADLANIAADPRLRRSH